jgi:catechol 2,3-dioxygenase-like lactoylglutathione lyase family enzyme
MTIAFTATKLVVADLAAAERFYKGLGLQEIGHNTGGDGDVRQSQVWLSAGGTQDEAVLILTQFLELPTPPRPTYPGEIWLCFKVDDVDGVCRAVAETGGAVRRAGEDITAWSVRSAVVTDPEGHLVEVVGPMTGL